MIQLFQKLGAWQENDAHVPQPGDVIFYDWDDSGVGDNTGWPDHVGIVESVNCGTWASFSCHAPSFWKSWIIWPHPHSVGIMSVRPHLIAMADTKVAHHASVWKAKQ